MTRLPPYPVLRGEIAPLLPGTLRLEQQLDRIQDMRLIIRGEYPGCVLGTNAQGLLSGLREGGHRCLKYSAAARSPYYSGTAALQRKDMG